MIVRSLYFLYLCVRPFQLFNCSHLFDLCTTSYEHTVGFHVKTVLLLLTNSETAPEVDSVWNVMAHTQKPDFVFRRNGQVHLNRRGRQFSRLLAAEVCASAVVMLGTPCSEVVWRVLATHSIRQFPLQFPSLRHRVPAHFNWSLAWSVWQIPDTVCAVLSSWWWTEKPSETRRASYRNK